MPELKRTSDEHILQARPESGISPVPPYVVLAGSAIIIVFILLAYYPCLRGGFIFDDDILLTENHLIQASDGLYQFWFTTQALEYYPVTNSIFWIEWRMWGMNPTGYRAVNLAIHIIDTLLLWFILRKLSIPGAFLSAMIFAVHPINVESVAWIAQLRNMLSFLFFLLSTLCYLQAETQPTASQNRKFPRVVDYWYGLSLVLFMLAMLSKGSSAVLPVMLLGIIWWRRKRLIIWDLLGMAPFFLASVGFTIVNIWFQTHGSGEAIRSAGFAERLLGAGGVVWFYLYKAILPINLAFVYPQWHINAGNPLWWLPLLGAVAVTAVLWRYRIGWSRPVFFAWGFFCVALAPVMGFADTGFMKYSLVADHYQHIAIMGVIVLAAAGYGVWRRCGRKEVIGAASLMAVMAVGTLAFLTLRQSRLYSDPILLYRATLEKNPDCWIVHNNLGNVLLQAGRYDDALEHFRQVLRLNPAFQEIHHSLGLALYKTGQLQEAIKHYEKFIAVYPDFPIAHYNLGVAFYVLGQYQKAIEQYEEALRLQKDIPEIHFKLGIVLARMGRHQEAIECYKQAIRLRRDYAEAYYNLGLAYAQRGATEAALGEIRFALELAQSQGQSALVKEIENLLNSYNAGQGVVPGTPPSSKSAVPEP